MVKKTGFTLIELVMIIVIIGIIAAFGLPKFVNFKTMSILKSEDAIIASINSAIKIKFTQNVTQGSEPDNAWPNENPLSLVFPALPYIIHDGTSLSADGYNWRWDGVGESWLIYCLHWNGNRSGYGDKGKRWRYFYGSTGTYGGWRAGDFFSDYDFGH